MDNDVGDMPVYCGLVNSPFLTAILNMETGKDSVEARYFKNTFCDE